MSISKAPALELVGTTEVSLFWYWQQSRLVVDIACACACLALKPIVEQHCLLWLRTVLLIAVDWLNILYIHTYCTRTYTNIHIIQSSDGYFLHEISDDAFICIDWWYRVFTHSFLFAEDCIMCVCVCICWLLFCFFVVSTVPSSLYHHHQKSPMIIVIYWLDSLDVLGP
jgi:hypothetical protein